MKLKQMYSNYEVSHKLQIQKNTVVNDRVKNRLIISSIKYFHVINIESIYYLQAQSNYCKIVWEKNKPIISSKTLKYFADLLKDHPFIRVHSSYLVNFNKIQMIEKKGDFKIILENGIKIPISRSYKDKVIDEILLRYSLF